MSRTSKFLISEPSCVEIRSLIHGSMHGHGFPCLLVWKSATSSTDPWSGHGFRIRPRFPCFLLRKSTDLAMETVKPAWNPCLLLWKSSAVHTGSVKFHGYPHKCMDIHEISRISMLFPVDLHGTFLTGFPHMLWESAARWRNSGENNNNNLLFHLINKREQSKKKNVKNSVNSA